MKPNVFVARKIPQKALTMIENHCNVSMWEEEDQPVPREILKQHIKEAEGLFCLLTDDIDDDLLQQAKKLKVISNMAVGYNNIDIKEASKRGIMVANTPGVLTETTADLTFILMMAASRRLVEASDYLREGEWKTWSPMLLTGQDIHGSTLGIMGLGRIGTALAKRAKGFDMKVLYHSRSRKTDAEEKLGLEYTKLENLFRNSDFVCILTPYTPDTHHLIGEKELSLMKPSSILVNTARGGIVNEEALFTALKDGTIWAAGLDVFEEEPVSTKHPLLNLPNVVALPHIGSASIETRIKMASVASQNLIQALSGDPPTNIINKEMMENKCDPLTNND